MADTHPRYPHLFEPVALGPVMLRNRIVQLPHSTFYPEADRPSDRHHAYYLERARGGIGLTIVECLSVHPSGHVSGTIRGWDPAAVAGFARTTEALHAEGVRAFAQLTHFGVEAQSAVTLAPLWAPSAVASPVTREIPRAMTEADVGVVPEVFAAAARNACAAGFDGVELKVGHDGLLRLFLSPYYNRREDGYGGDPESRARIVLEVAAAVRAAIGADHALGVRLSLDEGTPGGYGLDEGIDYARLIAGAGCIDYMTADLGTWQSFPLFVGPMSVEQGYAIPATAALKAAVSVPVIAFGRLKRPEHAEAILAAGDADLIGMTRQLLADPDWAAKARDGNEEDIRPCVACNQECIGRAIASLPISCVHNPAAGRELTLGRDTLRAAPRSRRVVVVGGGPSGLKAAEVAALRGHDVLLLEREPQLGGQVAIAASAPGHSEWGEIAQHLAGRVGRLGVEVRLGVEATADAVLEEAPDAVILGTGALPGPWPFSVSGSMPVMDEFRLLGGEVPEGQRVVLADFGVRFEPAALVEALAERHNEIFWVAPTPVVGIEVEPGSRIELMRRLADAQLQRMADHLVIDATDGTVTLLDVLTGHTKPLTDVDLVVVAGSKVSRRALADALADADDVDVRCIGDCVAPRHTAIAIYEGELAGRGV